MLIFDDIQLLMNSKFFNLYGSYGFFGILSLIKNWGMTRLFFPQARIVRFPIYVRGKSLMKLGFGFTTGVNVRLDAFNFSGKSTVLYIGDHVQINDSVHIGAIECVTIGDFTLIASRVFISDHNHGNYKDIDFSSGPNTHPIERALSSSPVHIGSNVWLGEQVCVLPGVTIGDGSIIGANSVVTHDVPANCIAAGNPAKVIRTFNSLTNSWVRA